MKKTIIIKIPSNVYNICGNKVPKTIEKHNLVDYVFKHTNDIIEEIQNNIIMLAKVNMVNIML